MKKSKFDKMRSAFQEVGCDLSLFSSLRFVEIGRMVFAIPPRIYPTLESMRESPYACGMEVGKVGERFEISLAAASFGCAHSSRRTAVNELGEKLFTYGRDVFLDNIVSVCPGPCFVVNERGECLGTGEFDGEMLRHRLDVGSYLRGFGEGR